MTFKHKIAYRNALCGHIEEWIQKTSLTKCLLYFVSFDKKEERI